MNYEECLLLPPEERRKVAAREILAKIKDGTIESEVVAWVYTTHDSTRIHACAAGVFSVYEYDFDIEKLRPVCFGWQVEDNMKSLGFSRCDFLDIQEYFEHEMMGSRGDDGQRTENLERVFEFIAATGRIPSVMDHTIPEGE